LHKKYIADALTQIKDPPVLVNAVSKRVRQLCAGDRPYVKPLPGDDPEDVALREIAAGKLTIEIDLSEAAENSARK
jgi:DNA-directed RNA polymerase omega subunit